MPFLTKLRSFASKIETVAGTAEVLADADNDVRVWELGIGAINVEMDESPSKYATGDFGLGESIPGPQSAQITFNTKFWADQTTFLEPNWTKFSKAAGCTVQAGVDEVWGSGFIVYPDEDKTEESLTIGIYDVKGTTAVSGLHYEFAGCVGNCSITAEGTGKPYKMGWEFTGALNDINDIVKTDIPEYSGSQVIPDRFANGTATIGGQSLCISNLEFTFGNSVSPLQCVGAATGFQQFLITDMVPSITLNPTLEDNSTYDAYQKLVDGTIEEIVIDTAQFRLRIPRAQIMTMSIEDSEGSLRSPITLTPLRPTVSGNYDYASWELFVKSVDL